MILARACLLLPSPSSSSRRVPPWQAPYSALRIELWDRDRLSRDDFIGEVFIALGPLMDGREHEYTLPLTDPEGKCGADDGLTGTVSFTLAYES